MRRRSRTGGKSPNAQARKTAARKSRIARTAARLRSSAAAREETNIARLGELMTLLYPWSEDGKQITGKSVNAYYWASELRRDYLHMLTPYQSPRLSAVQVVPQQAAKRTTVNVTILNERGERIYSDVDAAAVVDDKVIEHQPNADTTDNVTVLRPPPVATGPLRPDIEITSDRK